MTSSSPAPAAKTINTDVLVVGTGAGGLASALVAAASGAQVLLIEKSERYGGASASSGGGLWIPNSPLARAQGLEDSTEDAVTYLRALCPPEVSDEKIKAFVTAAPEMLAWMERHSELRYACIPYPDFHPELPGAKPGLRTHMPVDFDGRALGRDVNDLHPPASAVGLFGRINMSPSESFPLLIRAPGWRKILGKILLRYYGDLGQRLISPKDRFLSLGNALIGRLKASLNAQGVPVLLRTRLIDLVTDERRRVVGVRAEQNGQSVTLHASRAVILAAGGFEHDPTLRQRHLARIPDPDSSATPLSNTGDAIRAAMAIGAATTNMDSAWWATVFKFPGRSPAHFLTSERTLPGQIVVRPNGTPYEPAPFSYHDWGEMMAKEPARGPAEPPSYIVFDRTYRARFPMGPILPGQPDTLLPASVRAVLIKAESCDELARKTGLPAKALNATLAAFNAQVAAGTVKSKLPGLEAAPIATPPFYALPIYPGDLGTNGGLVTNHHAQVLDGAGAPIEGLYAIGNTAAAMTSLSSPGLGIILSSAMTFGYLAAKHIAASETLTTA